MVRAPTNIASPSIVFEIMGPCASFSPPAAIVGQEELARPFGSSIGALRTFCILFLILRFDLLQLIRLCLLLSFSGLLFWRVHVNFMVDHLLKLCKKVQRERGHSCRSRSAVYLESGSSKTDPKIQVTIALQGLSDDAVQTFDQQERVRLTDMKFRCPSSPPCPLSKSLDCFRQCWSLSWRFQRSKNQFFFTKASRLVDHQKLTNDAEGCEPFAAHQFFTLAFWDGHQKQGACSLLETNPFGLS